MNPNPCSDAPWGNFDWKICQEVPEKEGKMPKSLSKRKQPSYRSSKIRKTEKLGNNY
ncbi:MAG: hypothetical protein SAJ37_08430 [Oscillatoria sp. PMC 1068.18]|nr:hypothetical protein [Oscillatoria sp. PMC 1068.18]